MTKKRTPEIDKLAAEATAVASSDPTERPADGSGVPAPFLVVGIGASAGGIEALKQLFDGLQAERLALVVIQHLPAEHKSKLTEILKRACATPVVTIADGIAVEANHIYVLAPGCDLIIRDGSLFLAPLTLNGDVHLPINSFFASLAKDQTISAVGVVLSGTGMDGTLGLKAIKEAGGITFAQTPVSAAYGGMPQSAWDSGYADFALTPVDIAKNLLQLSYEPPVVRAKALFAQGDGAPDQDLQELFSLVHQAFGTDFAYYKETTIRRRLARRMALQQMSRLADYVAYVRDNSSELGRLHTDMLISVTRFFRVEAAFEALKQSVLSALLKSPTPDKKLRIWVPACATGEEPYTIAICLLELLDQHSQPINVQIFATDIDVLAIAHARRAIYPSSIAAEMSPLRLQKFFVRHGDAYHVSSLVRDIVVFSKHNALSDPPFVRLDLISCRNFLIYLNSAAQQKCLRMFHYALRHRGKLMLGTSETVGDAVSLFSLVNAHAKIYEKRSASIAYVQEISDHPRVVRDPAHITGQAPEPLEPLADRAILKQHDQPGVIVDEKLNVCEFRGDTSPLLRLTPGVASLNILKLVRRELYTELAYALKAALKDNETVVCKATYSENNVTHVVSIEAIPFEVVGQTPSRHLVVLFGWQSTAVKKAKASAKKSVRGVQAKDTLARITTLEDELRTSVAFAEGLVEEKKGSREELRASSEEVQSGNEELQSTNEELESSREEMQSANEELTTVNEELQNRMMQLGEAHDDLRNILTGFADAVVIVDLALQIRRVTSAADTLLGGEGTCVGRSAACLDDFTGDGQTAAAIRTVIETLRPFERELLAGNKRWYVLRIVPYITLGGTVHGAVVSFIDRDVRQKAEKVIPKP